MKKNLLGWFAMATMLVGSGCSSDEVVNDYSPENAIQFGTYVGRGAEGRGSEVTINVLKETDKGFGVYGYYTNGNSFTGNESPNFMYNQQVTFNTTSNKWEYSPLKYWPNNVGDKVSFLAYAPYDAGFSIKSGTTTSIEYAVSNIDIISQKDLLYLCQGQPDKGNPSTTDDHKTIDLTKQSVTGTVNFHFLHALSRIGFKAELMVDEVNVDNTGDEDDNTDGINTAQNGDLDDNTVVTINEIELIGKFHSGGTLNLVDGSWIPTTTTGHNFKLDNTNLDDVTFVGNTPTDVNIRKVNKDDSYIMIVPQKFEGYSKSDDTTKGKGIKIRVKYTVKTTDSGNSNNNSTITNDITSDEFNFDFVQGYSYSFNLHLGLTSVKLTAEVNDWNNGGDFAVNVPINEN